MSTSSLIPSPPSPTSSTPTARPTRDPRERTPDYTVVRMVNEGDVPFTGIYVGEKYEADPGEQLFVPFYAMCLWAGHPDAVDIDNKRRHRTHELKRLQVKYGTHSFGGCWTTEVCNGNPGRDGTPRHPPHRHLPAIAFYRVDDGTPYATVLADPEGTSATRVAATSQDDLSTRAMADMQREIEKLQRDIAKMGSAQGLPTPPPAPTPIIPPMPGGDGRIARREVDEDVDDGGDSGLLPSPVPVSDADIEAARQRKPRIPKAPGPLHG